MNFQHVTIVQSEAEPTLLESECGPMIAASMRQLDLLKTDIKGQGQIDHSDGQLFQSKTTFHLDESTGYPAIGWWLVAQHLPCIQSFVEQNFGMFGLSISQRG